MGLGPESHDEIRGLRVELAAARARVAELERWLDVTWETSPVAMGIVSTFENRYLRANPAMARLYGMSVEEIVSADPFAMALRITHPDDLVAEQKLFAELTVGARRFYQFEKRFMRPDGSFRWGVLTFAGIFDDPVAPGALVGPMRFVVLQVVDTTDARAMAETLKRRDEELRHAQKVDGLGRLAAGIAHDFNNLLTVIIGHGEVLKALIGDGMGVLPKRDLQEDLEPILSASVRAASLTAQLLAHGRRETVIPGVFVLSDAVETLQRLLGRTLGAHVAVEQALTAKGAIFADQGQIVQVVMNLVLNARDAIADGGSISLATRDIVVADAAGDGALPGPGQWVALVVSDTGHGISPEVQARMFEPFFTTRADRPGTQGTGLGLATVQRIVTEVGGRIGVESKPGQGTTVTVYFPRVANAPKKTEVADDKGRPEIAPNSRRVLVVEDEPAVRSLVANVLTGAHYRVMVARDGEDALRIIDSAPEPFHLIVTDLMMPSIGGMTLATRLHQRGIPPRMLFISGYSHHTTAELSPYGNLLTKPFTPAELLASVLRALQNQG